MTAYLDNNIFVDIENESLTLEILRRNLGVNLDKFYYSASHIQEANEIKGEPVIRNERLQKRFNTISQITDNNYLYLELETNKLRKLKEYPHVVYETINDVSFGQTIMKNMVNTVSEDQKEDFRKMLNIDIRRINNYTPVEVIEQINSKSDLLGGYTFVGLIEKAVELHPQGKKFGLHNRIAGIFEMLDMIGYWKDKYTEKSNYARLWDSNHTFFSSFCDFFISNDKRTRNKARVAFEIYNIKTKIISSKGEE